MSAFLLGIAVLLALAIALNMAVRADPATVSKVVRYGGATVLSLAGLAFAFTGRLGFAVPLFIFSYWLIGRPFSASSGRASSGTRRKSPGQTSQIETAFFSMQLDHDTGEMTGTVSAGQFSGRDLGELLLSDLLLLRREISSDPDSMQLLEAYLDRKHGADWREGSADYKRGAGHRASGPLNRERACEILGVGIGAGESEIRNAYKALMLKLHPDHGGSTHLAAEVNAAKDFLLGD